MDIGYCQHFFNFFLFLYLKKTLFKIEITHITRVEITGIKNSRAFIIQLVRNGNFQAPGKFYRIRNFWGLDTVICIFTSPPGDSDAYP